MLNKSEIRKQIKALVREQHECLPHLSLQAIEHLKGNEHLKAASSILLFYALDDEVCTHNFVRELAATKRVYLPVVHGETMSIAPYESDNALRKGAFDIYEPYLANSSDTITDVAVVPGVAFSPQGVRLGRGRGYYDKFLAQHPCYRIGLCFSFQLLDSIPCLAHDVRMNSIVTDKGTIHCTD